MTHQSLLRSQFRWRARGRRVRRERRRLFPIPHLTQFLNRCTLTCSSLYSSLARQPRRPSLRKLFETYLPSTGSFGGLSPSAAPLLATPPRAIPRVSPKGTT